MSSARVHGSQGIDSLESSSWDFSTSCGPFTDFASTIGIAEFIAVFINLSSLTILNPSRGRRAKVSLIVGPANGSLVGGHAQRRYDRVKAIERPFL
jgi:hypothetical protein